MITRLARADGWRGAFLCLCLGAISVLGHAPIFFWPVTIICFALYFYVLDTKSQLQAGAGSRSGFWPDFWRGFWPGFYFGFGYFLAGLYWLGSAFLVRGGGYIWGMPFGVLGLCAILALLWGIAGGVYSWLAKDAPIWTRSVLLISTLFMAEFARGHILGGLAWNLPGYIFTPDAPIAQFASISGVYGLSLIMLGLSACGFAALRAHVKPTKKIMPLAVGALCLGGLYVYGTARLSGAKVEYVQGVNLRIVHANIPQSDKFDPQNYVPIAREYLSLSASPGLEDVTHVIWPEGAVPGLMLENENLVWAIGEVLRQAEPPPIFITQSLRSEPNGRGGDRYYNSAAALTFDQETPVFSSYYDKKKLVLLGEYLPGGDLAARMGLETLSTAMATISPGRSNSTPAISGLPPVSIQICFEVLFPGLTPDRLEPSGKPPQWILNLSNDSWFGANAGPKQASIQARYRAIEEGLPLVRATSGGISGVYDAYGRPVKTLSIGDRGVIDSPLPKIDHETVFFAAVNWCLYLINLNVVIWLAIRRRKRRIGKRL